MAPIQKSPGWASGIHHAFSERHLRHNLSILALTVRRRSVRDVGILGKRWIRAFSISKGFSASLLTRQKRRKYKYLPLRRSAIAPPSRKAIFLLLQLIEPTSKLALREDSSSRGSSD